MADLRPSSSKKRKMYTWEELEEKMESGEWSDDDNLELASDISSSDEEELEAEEQPLSALDIEEEPQLPSVEESIDIITSAGTFQEVSDVWSSERPAVQRLDFSGEPGLKVFPEELTPFGFLKLFFTTTFIKMLVDETNNYAEEVFLQCAGFDSARIFRWKETSAEEMTTFVGILFYMGIVRLNRIRDYWKTHHLFRLSVTNYMSRDRFWEIFRCLHFHKNEPNESPLNKIAPIMDHFNDTMKKIYYPGKKLSLDESMVAWRGRLKFRQYIQGKKHKYGMKLYVLAEPKGMVQSLHIYGGADDPEVGGRDHAAKVVRKLIGDKTGVGHSLFMNNYYMSIPLVNEMVQKGCYCTGTLRANRKNNPREVTDKTLRKGEVISRYNQLGVCVCKWRDKRDVLALSSEFSGDLEEFTTRRGRVVTKPQMILHYNQNMKGVDSQDQMLAYYPMSHKSLRWYKKLGIHIFQIMMVNAHFLYSKTANLPKKDLHDFQLDIISSILPKKETPLPPRPSSERIHLPSLCPKSETNNKTMRKRCKVCMKSGRRIDSIYYCPDCPDKPGYCLEPCFREDHKY